MIRSREFEANELRRLIDLLEENETLHPELADYIRRNPQSVSADMDALMANIQQQAQTGSNFVWAISELPDGRYFESFPRFAQKLGLPIVKQGDSRDLRDY